MVEYAFGLNVRFPPILLKNSDFAPKMSLLPNFRKSRHSNFNDLGRPAFA